MGLMGELGIWDVRQIRLPGLIAPFTYSPIRTFPDSFIRRRSIHRHNLYSPWDEGLVVFKYHG